MSKPVSTTGQNKIILLVFIAYILAVLAGALNHEPWADEAQVWLLVRDNNIFKLLSLLPAEGHPPLWYLLLVPIVKLGLPYKAMQWLAICIAIAGCYVLLFKTKLPLLLKLSIPLSYFFLYEYAAFARSYCMLLFFIPAVIALYPQRFERPFLFALCVIGVFNTHVLMFGFSVGLSVLFIYDAVKERIFKGKVLIASVLMWIGGLYLVPYLAFNDMVKYFHADTTDHITPLQKVLSQAFVIDGLPVLGYTLFMLLIIVLLRNTKVLLLFLSGAFGLLYILMFRYSYSAVWHYGLLFMMAVAAYGISFFYPRERFKDAGLWKYEQWLFPLTVVLQLLPAVKAIADDVQMPYSGAADVAEYITENKLDTTVLVTWGPSNAIAPYLPADKKIFNAECERMGTYYVYDTCFARKSWERPDDFAIQIAYQHFKDSMGKVTFIVNFPLQPRAMKILDLLYTTPPTIREPEIFYVYRFKKEVL